MPSPLIHLHLLFEQFTEVTPSLALGAIAPDAIHMRAGNTWADKAVTHFYEAADLGYDSALTLAKSSLTTVSNDFRRGYLFHLYTDYLWRDELYGPFFHKYKNTLSRPDLHALYYKETQALDQLILKVSPWRDSMAAMLAQAEAESFELLSWEEINSWRFKVLKGDLEGVCPKELGLPEIFTLDVFEEFGKLVEGYKKRPKL